jgi:hypothetical protein
VAHTCNPNYSGGRNQEDPGSKPAQGNSSQDPILKNIITKKAGRVAQSVGPVFKSQYGKKSVTVTIKIMTIILFLTITTTMIMQPIASKIAK